MSQLGFSPFQIEAKSSLSDDDDDFEHPTYHIIPTQKHISSSSTDLSETSNLKPLKSFNVYRSSKRSKPTFGPGKENHSSCKTNGPKFDGCSIKSSIKSKSGYLGNALELQLLNPAVTTGNFYGNDDEDFEPGTQLNELMDLCAVPDKSEFTESDSVMKDSIVSEFIQCPLCGGDISMLSDELRQIHTNDCLDKDEHSKVNITRNDVKRDSFSDAADVKPVLDWLHNLGLFKYEEIFLREEIDWDTLQWLTEEDLLDIGITALGPRKKIVHSLNQMKNKTEQPDVLAVEKPSDAPGEIKRVAPGNKLITEFFQGPSGASCGGQYAIAGATQGKKNKMKVTQRNSIHGRKFKDAPSWCCIPGTPFRVDSFRYLCGSCSHWFLTHFHLDHYQGLTRGFCHGKIYCSLTTARLVNTKIGVPWDKLHVLPLNEKINISGIDVTCLDANHCPGSIIILFEPPNKKPVLHTGDFRFCGKMASSLALLSCSIHTLIVDTTYCNPEYDFPKQEAVIQFVIEAIQAETFNPRTLFLIGSYTIGKERLFLEVARFLQKKVYINFAKLRLLECLELSSDDMEWFTLNEQESQIHVVPMWTVASFKRMKQLSEKYSGRFNLIVAFSPTGWTYGKGKRKALGRRWQQGTIIRYEVPYSEHSSFTELREFVRLVSPVDIIPSVNNDGPHSADAMVALLLSDSWNVA